MSEKIKNGERTEGDTHLFLNWMNHGVTPIKNAGNHVSCRATHALEIRLHPPSPEETWQSKSKPFLKEKSARQIDTKTEKKIKQGKIRPQGRLDLHGYRYDAARTALHRFILDAVEKEARCLLVITGKGDLSTPQGNKADLDTRAGRGVIRRAFLDWLKEPPFERLVLGVYPASPAEGGSGAWYIYLRRAR